MTTEVALLRGPTNLASPTSSTLRYLANGDSDVSLPRRSSREEESPAGLQEEEEEEEEERWSFLALLLELLRKSLLRCSTVQEGGGECGMEIGWPTDVQHVAHVTFDRFHGFLGLPVELEPEVPRRAPSARYSARSSEQCGCCSESNGF
jgi:hypothetical protein